MRLEEIAHRLSAALTVNDFRAIEDDIRNHIVDRDEPVTRERCKSLGAKLIGDLYAVWEWTDKTHGVPMRLRLHADGDAFLVGTTYVRRCENMGDVFDLLSGLGVR